MAEAGTTSSTGGPGGLLGRVAGAARSAARQVGDHLPGAVVDHLPAGIAAATTARTAAAAQTLTLSVPDDAVRAAWRDAAVLSRVLGDLGRVERAGELYRWTLGDGAAGWDSRLAERPDGLRFSAADADDPASVDVRLRAAPADLGTEVRLALDLPVPAALAGTAAFTVLYRLRALLQTGEIATLGPQPAARAGER